MNKLDLDDKLEITSQQLKIISELMQVNLNLLPVERCEEIDRLYFLTNYIKQISDNTLDLVKSKGGQNNESN